MLKFEKERHMKYFAHCLHHLPSAYSSLDTNRLTLVHFAVQSLDLLGALDDDKTKETLQIDVDSIIEWIYSLQVLPHHDDDDDDNKNSSSLYDEHCGFKGGTFLGPPITPPPKEEGTATGGGYVGWEYDHGHIAMTYTALTTLATLGDDLSRIDKNAILTALKALQRDDGSFQCISVGSEHDMRFLYCACAISSMLHDWSAINIQAATSYIISCKSYDGALSLIPGQEGHGGSTFCGIASLVLMGQIHNTLLLEDSNDGQKWMKDLIRWCTARQIGGMQGRPNKNEDTCYSYWIGGTLYLILQAVTTNNTKYQQQQQQQYSLLCEAVQNNHYLLDTKALKQFVLSCQTDMGGFSKVQGAVPDLLHSFYSLAWLSLSSSSIDSNNNNGMKQNSTLQESEEDDDDDKDEKNDTSISLRPLDCALGIPLARTAIFQKVFSAQNDTDSDT